MRLFSKEGLTALLEKSSQILSVDNTLREFSFEGSGLKQESVISPTWQPKHVLWDNDRNLLLLDDWGSSERSELYAYMRQEVSGEWINEKLNWSEEKAPWVRCWAKIGRNRIGILDYDSEELIIYEFV